MESSRSLSQRHVIFHKRGAIQCLFYLESPLFCINLSIRQSYLPSATAVRSFAISLTVCSPRCPILFAKCNSHAAIFIQIDLSLGEKIVITIGNVVGSNIANIALILGLTGMIHPIPCKRDTLRIDMPFMILATFLFISIAMMGEISRWVGICFIAIIVSFVTWQVIKSRKDAQSEEQPAKAPMALWKAILIVLISIGAMIGGANLLIDGASGIAMQLGQTLGIDQNTLERIIGLTIVAVGTSLPETFASVIAARKGETDMAIGNIIGSVTFNILCVIGVSSAICPILNTAEGFRLDYCIMLGLGLLLWIFMATKKSLERWEGILLFVIYIAFIAKTITCM